MKGPCLCGDPYCPSCGDPSLAEREAADDALFDKLEEIKAGPDFVLLLTKVIQPLNDAIDKMVEDRVNNARQGDAEYISLLEEDIRRLKED